MLYTTSLVAFVGAGEQPALTPRKLTLLNSATGQPIQDVSFVSSVLGVRMSRRRLVVVLEQRVHVHDIHTLQQLCTLDTPPNPRALAALAPCDEPSLLALPALPTGAGADTPAGSGTTPVLGAVRVYDLMRASASGRGDAVAEAPAHLAPLAALAWSQDGALFASASTKGTVVRVHAMPGAAKVAAFRRGATPATIHSLAFCPGKQPRLLAASSSHGTIHLFRLEAPAAQGSASAGALAGASGAVATVSAQGAVPDRPYGTPGGATASALVAAAAAAAASAASSLLSVVVAATPMAGLVEPLRCAATVRLPVSGVPAVCALVVAGGARRCSGEASEAPTHALGPIREASSSSGDDGDHQQVWGGGCCAGGVWGAEQWPLSDRQG